MKLTTRLRAGFELICAVAVLVLCATPVRAGDYASEWGPKVGTTMPILEAEDQSGRLRTLADLAGKNGLLIFLNRSADW